MKRLSLPALFLVCLALAPCQELRADEKNIIVTAEVPESPAQMTVVIRKFTDGNPDNDPWTNSSEVTSLDFGRLTYLLADNSNAGLFYSSAGFCVNIYTSTFGKPYEIRSTCTGVTSGDFKLPDGSFGIIPMYSETDKWQTPSGEIDQGAMPQGATLGSPGPATTANSLIYSSEAGDALGRILQVYYTIPPYTAGGGEPFPGYVPIPLTQPPGQYTGTVQLTLSLK